MGSVRLEGDPTEGSRRRRRREGSSGAAGVGVGGAPRLRRGVATMRGDVVDEGESIGTGGEA
jgi:hypothetical protein